MHTAPNTSSDTIRRPLRKPVIGLGVGESLDNILKHAYVLVDLIDSAEEITPELLDAVDARISAITLFQAQVHRRRNLT